MFRGRAAALPRWESDVTAPGQRGFVLEALPGDEEDLLSAVLAALAQSFTVTPEPGAPGSGVRRCTWLDTFDWRLYRAGLMLQFEQARRGGRLLLSKTDGTPQAEQAVTSWPRRPPLDLPEGPVRDRIVVLIRPRALLPIVKAVSTASVTQAAQRRRQDRGPAGRGPCHGDRAQPGGDHRRARAAARRGRGPRLSRPGAPGLRAAGRPCRASRTPARACSSRR